MTIYRHNKTGKLYTIAQLVGGHKYTGRPYEAVPYGWKGKTIGGFRKGKSVALKDFTALYETDYVHVTRLNASA